MNKFLVFAACTAWTACTVANQENLLPRQALTSATRTFFAMPFEEVTKGLQEGMRDEEMQRQYPILKNSKRFAHMSLQEAGYTRFAENLLRNATLNANTELEEKDTQSMLARIALRTFAEVANFLLQQDQIAAEDIACKFDQAKFNAQEAQEFLKFCQTKREALQAEPSELNSIQQENLSTFIAKLQKIAEQKEEESKDADSAVADDAQDQASKETTQQTSEQA